MVSKKGYLFINLLVICLVTLGLFSVTLSVQAITNKHYREQINQVSIKSMLESRAIYTCNTVNITKKVGLGFIEDSKYYYKVEIVDGAKYRLDIKYYEMMEMVYYQIFESRYTKTSYEYIIYEEGYYWED